MEKPQTPDWSDHHAQTKEYPPSPLLIDALSYMKAPGETPRKALDVGSGALKDTRLLLNEGFQVTAIDHLAPTFEALEEFAGKPLHIVTGRFDETDFGKDYDLINAMFSLPFNPPDVFERVFPRIKEALAPNGVFSGNFFGPEDGWRADPYMTFHTLEQVRALFEGFEILYINERQKDGTLSDGKPKHWHVIDVIARKPST